MPKTQPRSSRQPGAQHTHLEHQHSTSRRRLARHLVVASCAVGLVVVFWSTRPNWVAEMRLWKAVGCGANEPTRGTCSPANVSPSAPAAQLCSQLQLSSMPFEWPQTASEPERRFGRPSLGTGDTCHPEVRHVSVAQSTYNRNVLGCLRPGSTVPPP